MNNLTNGLLNNRGFAGARINADNLTTSELKAWHEMLNRLQAVAYDVAATRYNEMGDNNGMIVARFYDVLKAINGAIGTLDNGARLRCDANACNTIVALAVRIGVKRSPELKYVMDQKTSASKYLKELEEKNGTSEEAKEKLRTDIAQYEEQIEALKAQSDNQYKEVVKAGASAFYKAVEDFLADQIAERRIMTEAEVQAEKKRLNDERKARRNKK